MNCPKCNEKTRILNAKEQRNKRRRQCTVCGYRFSTYEITEDAYDRLLQGSKIPEQMVSLQPDELELIYQGLKLLDIHNKIHHRLLKKVALPSYTLRNLLKRLEQNVDKEAKYASRT
jgi:transcriptional regulator NrdR family protein